MRQPKLRGVVFVSLLLLLPWFAGAAEAPVAVSPGSASRVALIGDGCPTFSWGAAEGARSYELVVYRLAEDGEEAQPVLSETFAGSASSWTPSLERCLERGGRYAWSVRARGGKKEASEWSALSLFQVAQRLSEGEFEEAVGVVRSYLAAGRPGADEPTDIARESVASQGPSGATGTSAAPAATQLSVDGNIAATSFTGDGENLANVATDAELATHAGAADAHREHATLEESLEITGAISIHAGGPAAHHVPVTLDSLTPTAAKGDLLVENGAAVAALPVGADGQVLVADSGQSAGMIWATVADSCPICSSPALVPKTGQTTSYDNRDDGELERGIAWPTPRFTDNTDGTVTDNLTGLIWLKDASCFALAGTDASGRAPWATALSAANLLANGTCGLTDGSPAGAWRLPNLRELQSLVHYGVINPALPDTAGTGKWTTDGDAFSGVESFYYWSSTTYAGNTSFAWYVYLGDGFVDAAITKAANHYVWPVRGGQ